MYGKIKNIEKKIQILYKYIFKLKAKYVMDNVCNTANEKSNVYDKKGNLHFLPVLCNVL